MPLDKQPPELRMRLNKTKIWLQACGKDDFENWRSGEEVGEELWLSARFLAFIANKTVNKVIFKLTQTSLRARMPKTI